jgi:hypothetical protein
VKDDILQAIQHIIQEDVGHRGLRTDPEENLVTVTAGDFAAACRSLAETPRASVAVLTGFYIPHAEPPAGETDGPLGALFLARALGPIGIRIALVTDLFCCRALEAGLAACGLTERVPLLTLPPAGHTWDVYLQTDWKSFSDRLALTHLIALERVGPSHNADSLGSQPGSAPSAVEHYLAEVSPDHHNRCHTMRGRDISAHMSPAHLLVEAAGRQRPAVTTIGIGDGGNEIGMGKIPWAVIHRNVPGGGRVACRVATDHLIVCGVSNWGAYGLAAGVGLLRGHRPEPELFEIGRERELLRIMVEQGPLVDGMTGRPTVSVDGLPFERYAEPLRRLGEIPG